MLQYVKIHVAADGMCDYPEDQFCAGGPDEKGYFKDSCTGDSGGPLECMDSKSEQIVSTNIHDVCSNRSNTWNA